MACHNDSKFTLSFDRGGARRCGEDVWGKNSVLPESCPFELNGTIFLPLLTKLLRLLWFGRLPRPPTTAITVCPLFLPRGAVDGRFEDFPLCNDNTFGTVLGRVSSLCILLGVLFRSLGAVCGRSLLFFLPPLMPSGFGTQIRFF